MTSVSAAELRLYVRERHHEPVPTAHGVHQGRPSIWLRLRLETPGGRATHWSEACPLPGFGPEQDDLLLCHGELAAFEVDSVLEVLRSDPETRLERAFAWGRQLRSPAARHGLEWVLVEAIAGLERRSPALLLWEFLQRKAGPEAFSPLRVVVRGSAVLDPLASHLEQTARVQFLGGFRTLKLKCGRDSAGEEEALRRLSLLGLPLRLRLDANCGWTLAEAERMARLARELSQSTPLAFDWFEDPTPDPQDWLALRQHVRIAADELLVAAEGAPQAADVWILKPMIRGIERTLLLAQTAARRGIDVSLSHSFDGWLALRASTELACALQSPRYDAGLGPHVALGDAPDGAPLLHVDGPRLARLPAPSGDELAPSHAARIFSSRVALDLPGRSVTFTDLLHGSLQARLGELPFVPVVARPDEESLFRLHGALQTRRPALLLHPAWPAALQETTIARALQHAGELQPEDAAIVPTSGSSGTPKLALHTRASLLAATFSSAARLGTGASETPVRWLLSLPFAHVGGLSILLRCLVGGHTVVVREAPREPQAFAALLASERITHLSLVPTQLGRWLADDTFRVPPSVEQVLVGGAPLSPALAASARARGVPILPTYGLTEMGSQVATSTPESLFGPPAAEVGDAIGPPLPGVRIERTEDGRLLLGGSMRLRRYLGEEPLTEPLLSTGDLGALDEQGMLHVSGRWDRMIVSGGENVSPERVEALLAQARPGLDVCVLGVPDAEWGQKVVAVIGTTGPDEELVAALQQVANAELAPFERPKAYEVWPELPRLPSGKVDHVEMIRLWRER